MAATYTVKQVAKILGYSTNSIYTFLKEKRLKGIRVGKGRFRIPQSEMDRLLTTSKSEKQTLTVVPAETNVTQNITPGGNQIFSDLLNQPSDISIDIPTLFDWFAGISAIVLGLSISMFTRVVEEFATLGSSQWMFSVMVTMITGGIGLLVSDFAKTKRQVWRNIFRIILAVVFGGLATLNFSSGDFEGGIIFGLISVALIGATLFTTKTIYYYCLFVITLIFFLPLSAYAETNPRTEFISFIVKSPLGFIFIIGWTLGSFLLAFSICYSRNRNRIFYRLGTGVASLILVVLSILYARGMYWGRAFTLLLSGIVMIVVPFWDQLSFSYRRDRKTVLGMFGLILMLFISAVLVIRVIQSALVDAVLSQVVDKVAFAVTTLNTGAEAAKLTISHGSQNPELIRSLDAKKSDPELALNTVKAFYETRGMLDRISVLNAKGEMVALYPYEDQKEINWSVSPWFTVPVTTKNQYVSPLSNWPGAGGGKGYIISSPVINDQEQAVGVLAGFLPVNAFNNKISALINIQSGEYISIADGKTNQLLVHPDKLMIGQAVASSDPAYLGSQGQRGGREVYGATGERLLSGYSPLSFGSLGLSVSIPAVKAIQYVFTDIIIIFILLILSILIIAFSVFFRFRKVNVYPNSP